MNTQINKASSDPNQAGTTVIGARHRVRDLDAAITYLTRLPGFAAMDARLRLETDSLVAEMERAPFPRQAFDWFDRHAEAYLILVTDLASWDSYRILVHDLLYPLSSLLLFGFVIGFPQFGMALSLDRRLRGRIRYWQQKSSAKLAGVVPLTLIVGGVYSTPGVTIAVK